MNMFTDEIKTNTEAQALNRRWIKVLRSDEYQQGGGRLRTLRDEYCCLGVACNEYDPKGWVRIEGHGEWGYSFSGEMSISGILPFQITEALCLVSSDASFKSDPYPSSSLTTLNDSGHNFKEIADIIEQELEAALTR